MTQCETRTRRYDADMSCPPKTAVWTLLSLVAAVLPVAADDAALGEAQAIYREYMSPYCPGLLLADCRSGAAEELRRDILASLQAGQPADAVRADLERTFGERVLAAPRVRGFGIWAWATPGIFVGVGAAILLLWVRRRRGRARDDTRPEPPDSFDPNLQARMESELGAFERS